MSSTSPLILPVPDNNFEFLEEPVHAGARKLWMYWLGKCAGRPIPDRSDINLTQIADIAPHIVIVERAPETNDFRLRLVGSALAEITGEERTGQLISQIGLSNRSAGGNVAARWDAATRLAFDEGKPVFASALASRAGKEHLIYHGVSLPLTNGGTQVEQMIGGLFTTYRVTA
ncbi:PAS domain-containing protein [Pyruvatibacter sp.]|uniref:PAS domain-containing protein n=1 Tax=Pyruvatibacter sp. TaxID=1981328 RepID=UPI0032EE4BDA